MNAELIIAILLAFTTATSAFVLFLAMKTINDMNYLCGRLDRRIDYIKKLEKEHRELSRPQAGQNEVTEALKNRIFESIRRIETEIEKARHINVVDKDKPLDFPNDHKEDN